MCKLRFPGVGCLSVLACLVCAGQAFAQVTADPEWPENPRVFGGALNERPGSVCQTSDGGYVVAGWTDSFGAGAYDVLLIKLDAQGNLDSAWDPNPKTFGGESSDSAWAVQQTSDGGYIIAGRTRSFGAGHFDAYLIKLDRFGNLDHEWTPNPKTFGGESQDEAYAVQQTSDGGFVVVGGTFSFTTGRMDVYVFKLDPDGELDPTWDPEPRTFGGPEWDVARCVQQTSDGGYVVAGCTDCSSGSATSDVYLIKLDVQGNLDPTWDQNPRIFGGEEYDTAYSIQQATDGGYLVVGCTDCLMDRNSYVYLIKLDREGHLDPTWDPNPKTLAGERGIVASSVQQTSDGGFVIAGACHDNATGRSNACVMKLDSQGSLDPVWDPNPKLFGGVLGSPTHGAHQIQQTQDEGYVVAGWQYSAPAWYDIFVQKLIPARRFLRGDCDGDGSFRGITDAVFLLEYLFRSGAQPGCLAACDANGDGSTGGVADSVYILQHAFFGTEPPPPPYPSCGPGQLWTDGPLTCVTEPECP